MKKVLAGALSISLALSSSNISAINWKNIATQAAHAGVKLGFFAGMMILPHIAEAMLEKVRFKILHKTTNNNKPNTAPSLENGWPEGAHEWRILCLFKNIDEKKFSPEQLEDLYSHLFDETIKQMTQNQEDHTYLDRYIIVKILVRAIKNYETILEKFLKLLATFRERTDYSREDSLYIFKRILEELLYDQHIAPKIIDIVEANFYTINPKVISSIVKHPNFASKFSQKAIENIETVPYSIAKVIFKRISDQEKTKLLQKVKELKISGGLFENFANQKAHYFFLQQYPEHFPQKTTPKTQSEYHLKINSRCVDKSFSRILPKDKATKKMFSQLYTKEKEEHKKGNYTFVHAQKWDYHFFEDIFRHLWNVRYSEKINNYRFLRFESKKPNSTKENKKKREKALKGEDDYSWWKYYRNLNWGLKKHKSLIPRLFVNHAVFGNAGDNKECSVSYWMENREHVNLKFSTEYLFFQLGLRDYYQKYADRLQKLQELHKSITQYGNMLLISFTENQLKKCVVPVWAGGSKRTVNINGTKTDDIKLIMDTLRSNPEQIEDANTLQYAIILTQDCALDPHNGPRIYSFNAPDEKKLKEYEKLRDEIFQELAQDVTQFPEKLCKTVGEKEKEQQAKIDKIKTITLASIGVIGCGALTYLATKIA